MRFLYDEPHYEYMLITPEIARDMLTRNTHNRPLKEHKIVAYAADMAAGRWRPSNDAITFSVTGVQLNGQNRCHAVIRSGKSVRMLVGFGLPDEAQEIMDTGVPRTLGDILKLRDEKQVHTLAATIRSCYQWDHASDPRRHRLGNTGHSMSRSSGTQLLLYFDAHAEEMRYLAHWVDAIRRHVQVSSTVVAPLARQMMHIDTEDAADFWRRVKEGIPSPNNYEENDPIVQLLKGIDRLNATRGRYDPTEMGALIVKAWNAYRSGEPIYMLRYRTGGSRPEPFPEMK